MKNIKTVAIIMALMTTASLADFTVKDLFISGGTKTIDNSVKK